MNKFMKKSLFKTSIISMLFILLSLSTSNAEYTRTCEAPFTPGITLDSSKFTNGGNYSVKFLCDDVIDAAENIEKLLELNAVQGSEDHDVERYLSIGIGSRVYTFTEDINSNETIYDILEKIGSEKKISKNSNSKKLPKDLEEEFEKILSYEKDFIKKPRYCNRIFTPSTKLYKERFSEDRTYNVQFLTCSADMIREELKYLMPEANFYCSSNKATECVLEVNNRKIIFRKSTNIATHKGYTIPDIIEGIGGKYSGELDVCTPQNIDIFRYLGIGMQRDSAEYIAKRCLKMAGCEKNWKDDWDSDKSTYVRLDRFIKGDTIFNFNKITENCTYNKYRIDTKNGCYYYSDDSRKLYKYDNGFWREDSHTLKVIDNFCRGSEETFEETVKRIVKDDVIPDKEKEEEFKDFLDEIKKLPAKKTAYFSCSKNEYANRVYLKLKSFLSEYQKFVTLTEDLDIEAISGGGDLYSGFLSDIDDEMEYCSGIGDHVAKVQSAIDVINKKNTAFCSRLDETKKENLDSFLDDLDMMDEDAYLEEDLLSDTSERTEFSGGNSSWNAGVYKRRDSNVGKNSAVLGAETIKAIYIADKAYDALYECFKLTYKRAEKIAKRNAGYDTSSNANNEYSDAKGPINYSSISEQISRVRKNKEFSEVCASIKNSLYYIEKDNFKDISGCEICETGGRATSETQSQLKSCLKAIKWTYDNIQKEKETKQNQSLGFQSVGYSPYGPVIMDPGSSGGRSTMPWGNEPVDYNK